MNGQFKLGELQPAKYFAAVAILIGLLFSFIAPDGDTTLGGVKALIQWQLQTVLPMLFAVLAHLGLSRSGALFKLGPWAKLMASGVLAALLFSPLAVYLDHVFTGEPIETTYLLASLEEFTYVAPPIVICWLAINAPFQAGWRMRKSSTEPTRPVNLEPQQSSPPNFAELLPEEIRGEVIYLKSELHYLQVVTEVGKALILCSLKNAINELETIQGVQPHRSYWVNNKYVASLEKNGREGRLNLHDGGFIPVSRSRLASVRQTLNL